MMKRKFIPIVISFLILFALSSCSKNSTKKPDPEKLNFSSADAAFEAMTNYIESGDYDSALICYQNGAADADDSALVNQYYNCAKAGLAYVDKGCIGYALNILANNINSDFTPAKALESEIVLDSHRFDGVYENSGIYLYILDGKIAVSVGSQLTGEVICTDELIKTDDNFFWAKHNADGEDEILYNIGISEDTITVSQTETGDEWYIGTYHHVSAEYPTLYY